MAYVYSLVLKRPWVKAEFQVPEQMVKLLSYLGIIFITLPFAPLSIIFVPIGAYINFKWEKYWLKKLYSKPKVRDIFFNTYVRSPHLLLSLTTTMLLLPLPPPPQPPILLLPLLLPLLLLLLHGFYHAFFVNLSN